MGFFHFRSLHRSTVSYPYSALFRSRRSFCMAQKIRKDEGVLQVVPLPGQGAPSVFSIQILARIDNSKDLRRLPKEGEKNILITSALPYCNNVPHLGNSTVYNTSSLLMDIRKHHWKHS